MGNIKSIVNVIIIALLLIINPIVNAQNEILKKKITAEFSNITINDAFRKIEKQLSIYFTFDASLININKNIKHTFKEVPLSACLDQILQDSSLIYKVIEDHVIIRNKQYINPLPIEIVEKPKFINLKGRIVDRINKEPIPFASIGIVGYSYGVVSNNEGEFILKIPDSLKHEQLCISNLGYTNICCPVLEFHDTSRVFQLERNYISIQEVIIRKTDAKTIIRNALKNVEKNYTTQPVYLTGFYRESVNQNNKYMFFSEAVMQIYKSPYNNEFDGDMVKVLKSRKMQDISMGDTVIVKFKSGLQSSLWLDIAKNQMEFLDEDNFGFYKYSMSDIVSIDDRPTYLIEFEPLENAPEAIYQGKLYIDIRTFAIVASEFQVNPKKISRNQSQYIVKKSRGIRLKMSNISYDVSYRRTGEKFYLNHVSGDLNMRIKKQGKLFSFNFDISFEMAISEVDSINVGKFKRKDVARLQTIFFDEVQSYDEDFWEQYNYILPDRPLQETIEKVRIK
jgi:hypothetical protein